MCYSSHDDSISLECLAAVNRTPMVKQIEACLSHKAKYLQTDSPAGRALKDAGAVCLPTLSFLAYFLLYPQVGRKN